MGEPQHEKLFHLPPKKTRLSKCELNEKKNTFLESFGLLFLFFMKNLSLSAQAREKESLIELSIFTEFSYG